MTGFLEVTLASETPRRIMIAPDSIRSVEELNEDPSAELRTGIPRAGARIRTNEGKSLLSEMVYVVREEYGVICAALHELMRHAISEQGRRERAQEKGRPEHPHEHDEGKIATAETPESELPPMGEIHPTRSIMIPLELDVDRKAVEELRVDRAHGHAVEWRDEIRGTWEPPPRCRKCKAPAPDHDAETGACPEVDATLAEVDPDAPSWPPPGPWTPEHARAQADAFDRVTFEASPEELERSKKAIENAKHPRIVKICNFGDCLGTSWPVGDEIRQAMPHAAEMPGLGEFAIVPTLSRELDRLRGIQGRGLRGRLVGVAGMVAAALELFDRDHPDEGEMSGSPKA